MIKKLHHTVVLIISGLFSLSKKKKVGNIPPKWVSHGEAQTQESGSSFHCLPESSATAIEFRIEMSIARNLHSFIIYHSLLTGFWRIKILFWTLNIFLWASMLPVMFFLSVCWKHTLQRLPWIQLTIVCLNLHFLPDSSILWPWRLLIHVFARHYFFTVKQRLVAHTSMFPWLKGSTDHFRVKWVPENS